MWAYGYADLAKLLGVTEQAIRQRVTRKQFDPGDLAAVCRAWAQSEDGLDPFWRQSDSPYAKARAPASEYGRSITVIPRG